MMRFDWRERPDLPARYDGLPGVIAWRVLLEAIFAQRDPFSAFDNFLFAVDRTDPALTKPCVFISHRQADWRRAEEVARIVDGEGCDYWLDIHDPLVAWASHHFSGAAGAVLLAAIIEIALLNSTHVIALQTSNSAGSKWIPYEFGRAKARRIYSSQAASWFEATISPAACGEYVYLAHQTFSDSDIQGWLRSSRASVKIVP
jgi:hypothetical protein